MRSHTTSARVSEQDSARRAWTWRSGVLHVRRTRYDAVLLVAALRGEIPLTDWPARSLMSIHRVSGPFVRGISRGGADRPVMSSGRDRETQHIPTSGEYEPAR